MASTIVESAAVPEVAVDQPRPPRLSLRGDVVAMVSAGFLLLVLVAAVAGPLIAPHAPDAVDLRNRLVGPAWTAEGSWTHVLGTDGLGRDVLSRIIAGARISMLIGVSVTLIAGILGTGLGLLAGYRGGRWDSVVMRVADAQFAFPGLLLLIAVIGALGPSVPAIILVVGLYGWMIYARLVRANVLQLRESLFVQAADMAGASSRRIVVRHILPSLVAPLLALSMLELARVVLVEASLSYLGLGIQPPATSWGLMVAENQTYLSTAWWTVVCPGLVLAMTVLAMNLVASSLRIRLDPHQRRTMASMNAKRKATKAARTIGQRAGGPPRHAAAPGGRRRRQR